VKWGSLEKTLAQKLAAEKGLVKRAEKFRTNTSGSVVALAAFQLAGL
jgi:hypothetical protein